MPENFENQESISQVVFNELIYTSLYHIDYENDSITPIDIDIESSDLRTYIEKLFEDIQKRNSKREFRFSSDTTEVRASLTQMIGNVFESAAETNANRLLRVEKETQESMDHLGVSIQKGSLFQSVIDIGDQGKMIIIGKADHNDFLDVNDLSVHKGFPWKKKVFKSFLTIINNSGEIDRIMVSDTTNILTKYWWSDFFELEEIRTNEHNTSNFLKVVDTKILNPIKKNYPADHTTLRNSVIGHFRSHDNFDLDELYDNIFKDYTPRDEGLPIENIKVKVKEIPEKHNLDSQFGIVKQAIVKRSVNKVVLDEGIELILKGSPNLDNITPWEDEEEEKYILIKTEEGYRRFKKENEYSE